LGEQCLRLAQSAQDSALLLTAHRTLGTTLFWLGEFDAARRHLEQGMALYDPQQHGSLALRYLGADPGVWCRCYAAMALGCLGYPEQAWQQSREALALAQARSHPFSLATALNHAATLQIRRGEVQGVKEQAEALMALSLEQGFPLWLAWATIWRGWALAEQGQGEEGIGQMRQGIDDYLATGAKLGMTPGLAYLAEAYGKVGQTEEGLKVVAEALTLVDTTAERGWEAEIYRLQGELLLKSEARSQKPEREEAAESCFRQALHVARGQSAKSWELRAAMSLSQLWQRQGKREEARRLLAEVYGWFTEGFDTADLQEAKALLEELA
jgi:predicted ATPase